MALQDLTLQQLVDALKQGKLTWYEAVPYLNEQWKKFGFDDAQIQLQFTALRKQLADAGVIIGTEPPGGAPTPLTEKKFWETTGFPEIDPRAAWQRAQGLPAIGRNPFQEWLAGQATPAFAGWGARAAAAKKGLLPSPIPGPAGAAGPSPFSNYLTGTGGQEGQLASLETLNQLRGRGSEPQQDWMDLIGSAGGPGLKNVLEAALRGKGYAGFVSRAMANRLPDLETGWSAQTLGGAQPGNTLLDYLMQKMGL